MPEYIDLYDLNHQATGKIHDRALPVPEHYCSLVVSFWVRDAAGRLLLEQRSPQKHWFPRFWECGGGSAQAGETGYDAVTRELAEETGLTPPSNAWRFLGALENKESLYDESLDQAIFFHHWNLTYMVTLDEEQPELHLQAEEVSDFRWFTPEELDAFCETNHVTVYSRRLWNTYRQQLTSPIPKAKKR